MVRTVSAVVVLAGCALAQNFEVASVKPSPPFNTPGARRGVGKNGGPGTADPTRVRFLNFSLKSLIAEAYGTPEYQISGPAWTEELRFEIIATMPKDTSKEQFHAMLRNLLAQRFRLSIHNEQKTTSEYTLVVSKGGPKLSKPTPDPTKVASKSDANVPKLPPGTTSMGIQDINGQTRALLQAYNQPLSWLIQMLSGQLSTNVDDETGLTENYDYRMSWVPQPPGSGPPDKEDAGPSIFSALQEQLGLKLVSKKGPVQTIVIDRAESTPTEN